MDIFPPQQQTQIRTQLAFALLGVIAQRLIPRADGSGRVLATEVLIKTSAVATQIREGRTHQTHGTMEAAGREGMITMDARLQELFGLGQITYGELSRRVTSSKVLDRVRAASKASGRSG